MIQKVFILKADCEEFKIMYLQSYNLIFRTMLNITNKEDSSQ